jgi:hypothetical protein
MDMKVVCRFLMVSALLLVGAVNLAVAGGPCAPPMCPPPMACPPPCPPPALCPPPCAPPCPPPTCGPPPCAPRCGVNPIAAILGCAARIVVGAVTLPFRLVECLADGPDCGPVCRPRMACAIDIAPPPIYCLPPMPVYCCPPPCGPPAFGYGMPVGRPVGFGRGAPRRHAPFAKKSAPAAIMAGPVDGVFGAYW